MTSDAHQRLQQDDELWEEFHTLFPVWIKQRQTECIALLSYILIFIGLFTGITGSFLISSMTFLQSNPVDATNELLRFAILQHVNGSETASVPSDFTVPLSKPPKSAVIATYAFSLALVSSLVASILDIALLTSVSSVSINALYHGPEDRRKAWQSLWDPGNYPHATITRKFLAFVPLHITFNTVLLFIIGYIPYLDLQGGTSLALTAIPFAYLALPGAMAPVLDFVTMMFNNTSVQDALDPRDIVAMFKLNSSPPDEYTVDIECLCWVSEHTGRSDILLRAMEHIGATTDVTLLDRISCSTGARRLNDLLSDTLRRAEKYLVNKQNEQDDRTGEDVKASLRLYTKAIALLVNTQHGDNILEAGEQIAFRFSAGWGILHEGGDGAGDKMGLLLHPDVIACNIAMIHSSWPQPHVKALKLEGEQFWKLLFEVVLRPVLSPPATRIHGVSLVAWAIGHLPKSKSKLSRIESLLPSHFKIFYRVWTGKPAQCKDAGQLRTFFRTYFEHSLSVFMENVDSALGTFVNTTDRSRLAPLSIYSNLLIAAKEILPQELHSESDGENTLSQRLPEVLRACQDNPQWFTDEVEKAGFQRIVEDWIVQLQA
ncbi:hypothetical protein EVG20_g1106 [Dentipellis fragilis]|uniref:DUF6535 domain-containing protein n=1 Tax=Dentipellis fragilis TaxID=205917 RepID=A0A4Y9ZBE7_9AGAM|nr:hypothetical protein EVG20_g1106 [Dentipellis fragilis]